MNNLSGTIALFLAVIWFSSCGEKKEADLVLPTSYQAEWADAEIGVIIHFDINLWVPETFDYGRKETLPDLGVFNPSRLSTDQWVEAARAAGAKYAVLVTNTGTGFTLWPSKVHEYHIGNTPWRNGEGDIVADFIRSCKKYSIKPGLYYITNVNTYYEAGYSSHLKDKPLTGEKLDEFNDAVIQQLTELWAGYGEVFEIWFDGGVRTEKEGGISSRVTRLIEEHQPQAVLFQGPFENRNLIRWVGNEDGRAPYPHWSTASIAISSRGIKELSDYHGNPDGDLWCPGEADFANRKKSAWHSGWLWHANQENHLYSVDELVDRYYTSVGRNANMLIGMGIDTSGLFPEEDYKRFAGFGKKISAMFGIPVAETQGKGTEVILKIAPKPKKINHVIIMEDITRGERIRKYSVEALSGENWIRVCEGISVGHKRIQKFDTIETKKVRLSVEESAAKPIIRNLAVYHTE